MQNSVPRESVEYVELLSEIFAEIIQKGVNSKQSQSKKSNGDITPSLIHCLQYIFLHGDASVRKIARGLGVSLPAASQLVDRCVKKGLLARAENESDRRLAAVSLTENGRTLVSRFRRDKSEWFSDLLDDMDDDKRAALAESLEEFIKVALLKSEQDIDTACVRCGIDHLAFCVVNKAHMAATGEPVEEF